ncbi:hypothetical protein [Nocardia suismassiliense]|uniref:hypothetical protein n=1 Tax=Nocardia suismassiliense TaxID=2077092 RepID=UPI00131EEA48|nr:hypothetical protein [Nocardia suismassiliense]
MFKTTMAAVILAVSAMIAAAPISQAARPPDAKFIANYNTVEACQADGESPKTGGSQWECEQRDNGSWDLYTY